MKRFSRASQRVCAPDYNQRVELLTIHTSCLCQVRKVRKHWKLTNQISQDKKRFQSTTLGLKKYNEPGTKSFVGTDYIVGTHEAPSIGYSSWGIMIWRSSGRPKV